MQSEKKENDLVRCVNNVSFV